MQYRQYHHWLDPQRAHTHTHTTVATTTTDKRNRIKANIQINERGKMPRGSSFLSVSILSHSHLPFNSNYLNKFQFNANSSRNTNPSNILFWPNQTELIQYSSNAVPGHFFNEKIAFSPPKSGSICLVGWMMSMLMLLIIALTYSISIEFQFQFFAPLQFSSHFTCH